MEEINIRQIKELVIQADYCVRNNLSKAEDLVKSAMFMKSSLGYYQVESRLEMQAADSLEEYCFALFEFVKQRDGQDYLSTSFSQKHAQKPNNQPKDDQPRRERKARGTVRSESNPSRSVQIYNIEEEEEDEGSGSSKSNSRNAKNKSNNSNSFSSQRNLSETINKNTVSNKRQSFLANMKFSNNPRLQRVEDLNLNSENQNQSISPKNQELNGKIVIENMENLFNSKKLVQPPMDFTDQLNLLNDSKISINPQKLKYLGFGLTPDSTNNDKEFYDFVNEYDPSNLNSIKNSHSTLQLSDRISQILEKYKTKDKLKIVQDQKNKEKNGLNI